MYQSPDSANGNKKGSLIYIGAIALMSIVCIVFICVIINNLSPEKSGGKAAVAG